MDGTGFETWRRVAVLVDGDNIRALHLDAVMTEAARMGKVDVRRVYGNAVNCNGWDGFRIVHASGAKNAADMFLAVDAMILALEQEIGAFVIASSDGDFTPVAFALRERGADVVGVGEEKAAAKLQAACTRFVMVKSEPSIAPLTPLQRVVLDVVKMVAGQDGDVGMPLLGGRLGKLPEGRSTWRSVLAERSDLFVLSGEGQSTRVRLTTAAQKVR